MKDAASRLEVEICLGRRLFHRQRWMLEQIGFESLPEDGDILDLEGYAGRLVVAAEAMERGTASTQRVDEAETVNAPARAHRHTRA